MALKTSGTVVVAGPKFCGKTTTCKRFAASSYAPDKGAKKKVYLQAEPLENSLLHCHRNL